MSLLILLLLGLVGLIPGFNCKSLDFKQSNLEEREEASVSSYALCMRVMADGNSNVAGKNVSFCDSLKDHTIKFEEYNICVTAVEDKRQCYTEIWERKALRKNLKE